MKLRFLCLPAALALAACNVPTVPDFTYYRLPKPQPLEAARAPLREAIVVDAFGADGLYADQALVYAVDADGQQLRQYHYQLWTDPPTRVLQRRLIVMLREAGLSREVTDELPASRAAIRIHGVLLRFDRVPKGDGSWSVSVSLKLRADAPDGTPLVDEFYRDDETVAGTDIKTSVDAYGVVLDRLFARFYADLGKHGDVANAR